MAQRLSIAIVGTGPAGFYAAQAFLRRNTPCAIDMIDRLPTPFGLVRAGVAPDHQSTKQITRLFDKILRDKAVRFVGNVELGAAVSLADLTRLYDIVILAFGAQVPRRLGIPGEDLVGVADATRFVNWYNAVPGADDLSALVAARTAVIVGNGNVALDIARLLAKTDRELGDSDINPKAAAAIAAAPLQDIVVVGRRGPLQASFTAPELSEFGKLAEASVVVSASDLPDNADSVDKAERPRKEKILRLLRACAEGGTPEGARPVRIRFLFCASPTEILGNGQMTGVRLVRNRLEDARAVATGETFDIPAELMVSAIGYRVAADIAGLPVDERRGIVANSDGRVAPGVYVVGWARRGPRGVIGTNRNDARSVVERILADEITPGKPGPQGLDALLAANAMRPVDYEGWRHIDAAEIAAANGAGARPRIKFTRLADMLAAAGD